MEKWSVIEHYRNILNSESGFIKKFGSVKIALIYPNKYEIAMQNIGYQRVYEVFNSFENVVCERFVLDFFENNLSIENQRFLREFDIIALSINYEEDVLNFIRFLNSEKIPVFCEDRDDNQPLIIAGGALTFINPAILIDLVDVQLAGDIDAMKGELSTIFSQYKSKKDAYLQLMDLDFTVSKEKKPARVKFRNKENIIHSCIKSEKGEFAGEFLVELSSGCKYSCRFCTASFSYRPFRVFDFKKIKHAVLTDSYSKNLGLISAAFGDLPDVNNLVTFFVENGFYISVSSLRADTLNRDLLELLKKGGVRSITIAEETCSSSLKKMVNKEVSENDILKVAEMTADVGIENLKLYYMIGLPYETYDDAIKIVHSVKEVRDTFFDVQKRKFGRLGKIKVSINIFIPKPFTPFQFFGMETKKSIEQKIKGLKKGLGRIANVKFDIMNYKTAQLQGYIARGERYLKGFYENLLKENFNVNRALKNVNFEEKILKRYDRDYVFEWERLIQPNFDLEILRKEYDKCLKLKV